MKAVIVKEANVIELQDVPEPQTRPDEIKVKIAYCGICGTDVKIIEGKTFGKVYRTDGAIGWPKKPAPPARRCQDHGAGDARWIADPGARSIRHDRGDRKDIKGNFKIGQLVAMNFRSACGVCYYCTKGMAQFCERRFPISARWRSIRVQRKYGISPACRSVAERRGVSGTDCDRGTRARYCENKYGDMVIITGGGPIGLLVLQLAIKAGASKVLVSTRSPEKRALAKQLGADVVVDPIHEDLLEISNQFTDGRGFSVCFEASGDTGVARQLILLANPAARSSGWGRIHRIWTSACRFITCIHAT